MEALMSAKLAEVELKHVISALDRIRLNLRGTEAERNSERLLEAAKATLALIRDNDARLPKET
jgi:hypothetical protein